MNRNNEFALVTDSDGGIGEAVVRRMAAVGPVILHGSDLQRLRTIASELPNPAAHLIWVQDLERSAEIPQKLSAFIGEFGAFVATFIHCGDEFCNLSAASAGPATVQKLFHINVFSATAIVRTLLKKTVNHGSLRAAIFISSIASRFGAKGYSSYAATKGALDSAARSLASELAPAVRVNTILCGGIATPGAADAGSNASTNGYLLGAGRNEDIAAMAEYLISDQARWITGQQFVVDGGKTTH